MKKIAFKQQIKATAKTVYEVMLGLNDIATYEQWTAVFNPTSTYEGSWNTGNKIYFIATDNGKRTGMVSEIVENKPFAFVSIKHYGILDGDTEITSGEQVDSWAGTLENYIFEEQDGMTTVTIEMHIAEEHASSFSDIWSKALLVLKEMVEH